MSDKKFNESVTTLFADDRWGKGSLVGKFKDAKNLSIEPGSFLLIKKAMQKVGDKWVEKKTSKGDTYYYAEIVEPKTANDQAARSDKNTVVTTDHTARDNFDDWA